jgi:hypothetical protein
MLDIAMRQPCGDPTVVQKLIILLIQEKCLAVSANTGICGSMLRKTRKMAFWHSSPKSSLTSSSAYTVLAKYDSTAQQLMFAAKT